LNKMHLDKKIDYSLQGKVRITVTENNKIVQDTGYFNNLILNQGMDEIAYRPITELFTCCAIGTGTTDTRKTNIPNTSSYVTGNGYDVNLKWSKVNRNGSLVTFPRVSSSFPISGSVVNAGDVGNLIKINNDNTFRISSLTGSNQARSCSVLNLNGTVPTGSSSNNDYTIYFTNQISMSNETQRCGRNNDGNNFPAAGGAFGTSSYSSVYGSNTIIHNRQFNFSTALVDSSTSIKEVGFAWLPFLSSPTLFSRVRLSSGSLGNQISPIKAGQNVTVYYSLYVVMNPTTAQTGSVNLNGVNKSGNTQLNLYGMSKVATTGLTSYFDGGLHGNEPYFFNQKSIFGLPSTYNNLYVFTSTNSGSSPTWGTNILRTQNYVTKSIQKTPVYKRVYPTSSYGYTISKVATFNDTESINSNWRSFGVGIQTGSNLMSFVFTSQQNKQNGYLLAISQSFNWRRLL